jgi:hypothetical protein
MRRKSRLLIIVMASIALGACSLFDDTEPGGSSSGSHQGSGNNNDGGDDSGTSSGGDDSGSSNGDDGGTSTGNDSGTHNGNDAGSTADANDSAPADGFDQFQHHNLDVVNSYRAGKGISPLVLDAKLGDFALAGSQQLSQDHSPHAHFIAASNDGTIWQNGFKTQAGENQGDPNGWPQLSSNPVTNEMQQIDQIQAAMYAEGPGSGEAHGHYMNMMNSAFHRLGVGLLEINGKLYLTNDFSD